MLRLNYSYLNIEESYAARAEKKGEEDMKRLYGWILIFAVTTAELFSLCRFPDAVYAGEANAGGEYVALINEYYELINNGNQERVIDLYGDSLRREVQAFFDNNNNNRENGEGIFGVESVEVLQIKLMESGFSYTYSGQIFLNTNKYFVKCNMMVDETDKYYSNGINYFQFYIGIDSDGNIRIACVDIPLGHVITENDDNMENTAAYIERRNKQLYGETLTESEGDAEEQQTDMIMMLSETDKPLAVDYVQNPLVIRVILDDGSIVVRDLKDYCKTVAAGEITVLTNTEALRACALAIKMFAVHKILTAGAGASSDITCHDQWFDESNQRTEACNAAVDYIFDYFLLDEYGSIMRTFYRRSSSSQQGEYCRQYGGILSQLGADELAGSGNDWKYILHYYYERMSGISYYNSFVSYGALIITTSHMHDWSGGSVCGICNAVAN